MRNQQLLPVKLINFISKSKFFKNIELKLNSKYIVLIIMGMMYFTSNTNAQAYKNMMSDNSVNFYDVVNEAENYFSNKDRGKGSGWKGYQRWLAENEYKYYPSGIRSNVDPYFTKHQFENYNRNNSSLKSLFTNGWEELGPTSPGKITGHYSFGMGRIRAFYVDPNDTQRLYIGSRTGGFWKSIDGGSTWSGGSTDFLAASGVNAMDASPTNPDSVLININNSENFTTHGIYRSVDGGDSWVLSNFNPTNLGWGGLGTNNQIYKIKYHPTIPNLIFIGTKNGIYRSTDNLATWNAPIPNYEFLDIDFHPTNPNIIYAYAKNRANFIYVSTDAGVTFSTVSIPGNNSSVGTVATSAAYPDNVYFCSDNGIWKSTNSGVSFSLVSNPGVSYDGFAVSDLNDSNMLAGYVDASFSTDGGLTFNQVTYWSLGNTTGAGSGHQNSYNTSTDYIHADLQTAECINGVFYGCTDGFLVKSDDNGTTWDILSEDVAIRMNYKLGVSQSNHSRTICGSQDNGTSINTESGWVEMYGADGMEGIIHPLNDNWMIGSVQNGTRRRTTNGGNSSKSVTPSGQNGYWLAPMFYDPNNQMRVYSLGENIHRSDDFGSNWTNVGTPSFSGTIHYACIAENNSDIMVVSQYQNIELSTNGGAAWTSIRSNLPNYSITDVVFDPNDDSTIIVTYGRYQDDDSKVYISHNLGTSWQNITYNLGDMPVLTAVIDYSNISTIYLGTEIGVYKKAMADTIWSLYNPSLPNVSIREMEIMRGTNTLRASTWGRGLWEYKLDGKTNFPMILTTEISNQPTSYTPNETIDQFVTSRIDYAGMLSNVYVEWSINNPTFGNIIPMSNYVGNQWKSDAPLPNQVAGTKMFFKVFAVGSAGDTSETYKFQYTVSDYEFCDATGNTNDGNLFLSSVSVNDMVNTSQNDNYTYYKDSLINLEIDSTYAISFIVDGDTPIYHFRAWIDYNKNGVFSNSEAIIAGTDSVSFNTGDFTVPLEAVTGDTLRMRIRLAYSNNSTAYPCGSVLGEVEDYSVIIKKLPYLTNFVKNTICYNDSLIVNGTTYNASNPSGQELFTNIGPNNLDSLVYIDLNVKSEIDVSITNNLAVLTSMEDDAFYQWLDCDNGYSPIALATNQSYTVPANGNYAVEITVGHCSDISSCENVSNVSINKTSADDISIYPNPNNGMFNVDFGSNNSTKYYSIYTLMGKIIQTGKTNSSNIIIDLSKESKSVYLININTEEGSKVYKLILQ